MWERNERSGGGRKRRREKERQKERKEEGRVEGRSRGREEAGMEKKDKTIWKTEFTSCWCYMYIYYVRALDLGQSKDYPAQISNLNFAQTV